MCHPTQPHKRHRSRSELRLKVELQAKGWLALRLRLRPRSHQRCGGTGGVCRWRLATQGVLVPSVHLVPIHHVPPRLDVVGPSELVLQVVSMLPDVTAQDRDAWGALHTLHQGVVLVGCRGDGQLVALSNHQPNPARAEASTRCARRLKLCLELVHGAESLVDGCGEFRRRGAARALGCHLQPKEVVVVGAATAVAEGGAGLDGCLLELHKWWLILTLQGLVDVSHVRQVVLVMVELHCRLVDGRLQGVVGVRQRWQLVGISLLRHPHRGHQCPCDAACHHVTPRGSLP
mmetsp:Transcript_91474/g.230702  ORF Transcript_91474/g.230702 Transcript_91474/m.230702 type:complete len:289 (+) Transcript_91474:263-1129(+)